MVGNSGPTPMNHVISFEARGVSGSSETDMETFVNQEAQLVCGATDAWAADLVGGRPSHK
jgi:hypothetical protein